MCPSGFLRGAPARLSPSWPPPINVPLLAFLPSLLISLRPLQVSRDHLPNEPLEPKSLSRGLLVEEPKLRQVPEILCKFLFGVVNIKGLHQLFESVYDPKEAKNQHLTLFLEIGSSTPEIQSQRTGCFLYVSHCRSHKYLTLTCQLWMLCCAAQHPC